MNTEQYSFSRFITYFMSYFLFMFMFLAFSYVINDFSDIKVDRASGKNKVIYDIKPYAIILSLSAMFILGNTPFLIITGFSISGIITIATIYFFGATYSIKFLRFKEKGLIGLIECAIAQKCLPLFILFFLVDVNMFQFGVWLLIMFMNGLRYILIHQLLDYENDIKAGVKTFLSSKIRRINYFIYLSMFIEITCLIVLLNKFLFNIWGICFILFYMFFEYIIFTVIEKWAKKKYFLSFESLPLEMFYNVFLPLILLFFCGKNMPYIFILIVVMFFNFFHLFKTKSAFVKIYFKNKIICGDVALK
ncbi:hypothetical protein AGMMS49938_13500 [Fibrobacterales bacterium]|nr:hypothetical protein AGMMS49938_13500 [Fibrobacterales bacterium]